MLSTCEALRLEKISSVGRTTPLIIECEYGEDDIPSRNTFLVKILGLPEIQLSGLYCELLGNLVAREFGILTPKPAIVHVSEEFIEANKQPLWERNIKLSPGIGVGCEYFSQGFTAVKSNTILNGDLLVQATLIYGFDLLSQNPDRNEHNPNCAVRGDKIIAFDFDQSLSFIYPILGKKILPWELSKLGFSKHVFMPNLKLKLSEVDWQPLIDKIEHLSQDRLQELCSLIPPIFGDYKDVVCEHFKVIKDNISQLEFELRRSLL